MSRPVAKSLHTITVIVQVAKLHTVSARQYSGAALDKREAVHRALVTLGLADRPDPYGLAAVALKQLEAGK